MTTTRDEIVEFLNSAKRARLRRVSFENRLAEVRSQAERLTKVLSPTPGSTSPDKGQEAVWAALADETLRYVEEVRVCGEIIAEVDDFIDHLTIPSLQREVLRLRHCNGLKWKQIQTIMRKAGYWYTEKYLWELHRHALDNAEECWNAEESVRKGREDLMARFRTEKKEGTEDD